MALLRYNHQWIDQAISPYKLGVEGFRAHPAKEETLQLILKSLKIAEDNVELHSQVRYEDRTRIG